MNQFYIFPFNYEKPNEQDELIPVSATIIYCENHNNLVTTLQSELKIYYETHVQTDEMYVFGGAHLGVTMVAAFEGQITDTFRYIPKSNYENLLNHTWVFTFDEKRELAKVRGANWHKWYGVEGIFDRLLNEGLLQIFLQRGGLIESNAGHHYVFPSKKHCDKFLRTGNVLLHTSEISFIAFSLLKIFSTQTFLQIYCETLSIISLALVMQELKRRILFSNSQLDYKVLQVSSSSSSEGLVNTDDQRLENSFILISASTSANILDRIIKKHPMVSKKDIIILYYLGPEDTYNLNKEHILCNLTQSENSTNGIMLYPTYQGDECEFCKKGSHPAKINGDVFLPENPKLERIIFTIKDPPPTLNVFVKQFGAVNGRPNSVIKASYKENGNTELQYEIYLDMEAVLKEYNSGGTRYGIFKDKLNDYIHQYIPSNTRYLVCLPDPASVLLAKYIVSNIEDNYVEGKSPRIITFEEIGLIQNVPGSSVVVASWISNGKNLLYLSRALRQYDDLKLIYFIAMARTKSKETLDFLKSNLRQGKHGRETNSMHVVEYFYCTNDVKHTSWLKEIVFLKSLKAFADGEEHGNHALRLIDQRINYLEDSMSDQRKGLANRLFWHSIVDNQQLKLRKNYAFLSYPDYHKNLSQADVYFTISSIFNKLRNAKEGKDLHQSEYVRKLIDPNNFNRFNDGIIQASILRAAHVQELCYHIDDTLSSEMRGILETLVRHNKSEQGEALLEFLYALASEKMTLRSDDTAFICELVGQKVNNWQAKLLCRYIESEILTDIKKTKGMKEEIAKLQTENKALRHIQRVVEGPREETANLK